MTQKWDEVPGAGSAVADPIGSPVDVPPVPPAPPAPRAAGAPRARSWRRVALFGLPLALVVVGWVIPLAVVLRWRSGPAPVAHSPGPPDGATLYAQNCAACHGHRGDGAGFVAPYLAPRPRDFWEAKFRLVTTTNGIASDDDLLAVLRKGVPGSAMPSFGHLSEPELRAVVDHVRDLTYTGVLARLRPLVEQGALDPTELGVAADNLCRPGPALEIPAKFAPATPDSIARGQEVYAKTCASCHGPGGRGDGPQVQELKNADGSPTRPRDLLRQFKGGGEPAQLYARIMLGMPGTPMPSSNTLPPQDVQDLLNYVRSLSRPGPGGGPDLSRAPAPGR